MRVLNVLSALLVMGCAVWLSVHHTHDLYRSVGFIDKHAWVAVLMAEVMFLIGGINVAVARFRNYKPGWPAYTGFFLGLGLVGWSNIASTAEYGLAGWLLGGSIVLVVLIMEMIMTHAVKKKFSTNQPASQPEPTNSSQPANRPTGQVVEDQPARKASQLVDQPKEEANQPVEPTSQPEADQMVERQPNKGNSHQPSESANQPSDQPGDQPKEEANQQPDSSQVVERQPTKETSQPTTQPTKKNVIQLAGRSAKRSAKKSTSQSTIDHVKAVAMDYFNQNKKWPSQRKLAELAGTTRHQAIKALDELAELDTASGSK